MMMKQLLTLVAIATTFATGSTVFGHGLTLNITGGNQLSVGHSNTFTIEHDDFVMTNPIEPYAAHGFVSQGTTALNNDMLRYDVVGPVWYTNGTTTYEATNTSVTGSYALAPYTLPTIGTVYVDGDSSGVTTGFNFTGASYNSHSALWELDRQVDNLQAVDPIGAYAIRFRISGLIDNNPSTPFIPVEGLLVFSLGAPYNTAAVASLLYEAAFAAEAPVPEPSTLVLMSAPLAMLALARRRRARRLVQA